MGTPAFDMMAFEVLEVTPNIYTMLLIKVFFLNPNKIIFQIRVKYYEPFNAHISDSCWWWSNEDDIFLGTSLTKFHIF